MTKETVVSLREELYDWAAREVEEGRADSVSALIAEALDAAGEAYRNHHVSRADRAGHAG